MSTNILREQLKKVEYADLSNFDSENNIYHIKKRVDIKLIEDKFYILKIKATCASNYTVNINWNNGSYCMFDYIQAEIIKKMGKMVKVIGAKYNLEKQCAETSFWTGWISESDLEVISQMPEGVN